MALDELWKYKKAYNELPNYRMGSFRKQIMHEDIQTMEPGKTYLDVGCGRGETIEAGLGRGLDSYGTDFVGELAGGRVLQADAEDLPYDDKSFDYVTCYDVLEHLTPGTEQTVLDELFRVCRVELIVTTNNKPSHLPDGTDLHVNKRERDVWEKDLQDRLGPEDKLYYKPFGPGANEWHWRVVFA
jgi:ubiquinone/menaquinone biosynthesis C-methylase UbiE